MLKQLTALLPALLPPLAKRFPLLPFLNPQIAEDLWLITAILSLCASAITYNFTRLLRRNGLAGYFAFVGLATAVLCLVGMLALVNDLILTGQPSVQDFSVRSMFVLLFVGIGICAGYGFACVTAPVQP
jgi:hypothetical protein